MTLPDILQRLTDCLPANPEHDGPLGAAAREVLEALSRPPVLAAPLTDEEYAEVADRYKQAAAAFPLLVLSDTETQQGWHGRIAYNDNDGHLMFITAAWPGPDDGQEVIVTPVAAPDTEGAAQP